MLKKARFAKPLVKETMSDRVGSAKSKGSSPGARRKNTSPTKKSASPARKKKSPSPSRKSPGGELKSAMKKGDGKEKAKKKTVVKSPDLTASGLKIVDNSGQGMTIVPLAIINAKDIGELCLASNNLRNIPPDIKRMTTLTKLDISRNGIRCTNSNDFNGIPAEFEQLVNLEELKISECNLPHVPPAIWRMERLKVLDISRNKINVLLPDVGNMVGLQKLNLQQTNISTLPPEIAYCQELQEILLWGNVIESLPETLPEMLKLRTFAVNYRSFCASVDSYIESEELLRKGKLTSEHIPIVIFELETLEALDLEECKINNIPDMANLGLKEFYLRKNFLSKVPPSLFNLNHLTVLDMSHNLLTMIPEEIGRLKSLEILRLSENTLERVPVNVGKLDQLEELNLADNNIHYLPTAIKGLRKLKAFYVEKNDLTSLPDEICELEDLETLDITENRITSLPLKMHMLKNLTVAHSFNKLAKCGLWLYKNPLVQPPPKIWKTEQPQKIFAYLKKLAIIKTENLQRQKLLLFGESQSGKTSLRNAFIHRKSMMTKGKQDKTRALIHTPWKTENNVEFMIHDFGGDEAYKMIYPLFLDANGLAIIVYNHSTYSEEHHYEAIGKWLDYFNIYMPGVVVKLVGTHLDNYEEFAIEEDNFDDEDENGNILYELSRALGMSSRASSRSLRSRTPRSRSRSRSPHIPSRSPRSITPKIRDEHTPTEDYLLKRTSTPQSSASSYLTPANITEELVTNLVEKQHNSHTENLQNQLDMVQNRIKSFPSGTSDANVNNAEYKHLVSQRKKLEFLLLNPLRIMPDISLVSSNEGLHGIADLIQGLELMAIDKSLFPHAQRSIPEKWNKFKTTLKQQKGFYLSMEEVDKIGKQLGIVNEQVEDSLKHFQDIGDILWLRDLPDLGHIVFHLPRLLVEILASIFLHDIEQFLDFEHNKIFMSKGNFERLQFENAREKFLRSGQISRPLLNCFWFYKQLSYEKFTNLLDLVPQFQLCYTIPEPVIPTGQLYSLPVMVLPLYNTETIESDFTQLWNKMVADDDVSKTMCVIYEFPFGLPEGVFEKLLCILQNHVVTRMDWKDTIYANTENEIFKISKSSTSDSETTGARNKVSVSVHVVSRCSNEAGNMTLVRELTRELSDMLLRIPGLVWNIAAPEKLWKSQCVGYNFKSVQFDKTQSA